MRRFSILCTISLILLAGCSTTGRNIVYNPLFDNDNNALTENNTEVVRKESVNPGKKITQNVDDEEDIVSLLGEDYYKNFDIPIVFNDAVKYFIQYFTTEKRKVFSNWLKRSRFYIPIIKEILNEEGLPEDLVYLAMIESGFNPKAYSPANASGPWQFIYTTGGRYGLRSNYWIDERRDPEKSTIAATKYLRDLFNQFGCWYLAAAGYNAGEGRVGRAIERHNTNNFWELVKYNTLPKETREYIPKLIAAAIIAKEPEKFGFGSITYDQPIKFMEVKVPAGSPLITIAKAASIDISVLKSINPEILRGITPPDIHNYSVKLPYSVDKSTFDNNLQAAMENEKKIKGISPYKARKGDTIIKIAKKYRITPVEIFLVNGTGDEIKVKPGMIVNIPRFATQLIKEADSRKVGKNKKFAKLDTKDVSKKPDANSSEKKENSKTICHIVKKGETLAAISNKYGMDIASIKSANNMSYSQER
ncbi:MAG: transglycosylase SLT domain-containing protein [Proteobacteria bacterium]|nr:transglycosylase SLT domain-containing protein [Pseudomonadota bacterium]